MTEEKNVMNEEPLISDTGNKDEAAPVMDVWGLLQYCFILLHSHAWHSMGLIPNPATGRIEKDLEQARIAIDTAAYLLNHVEAKATPGQLRELHAMLSDLQVNFVNQQKEAAS